MQEDKQLIEQLKEGDETALSALYDKYSGALYSVIIKMTHDQDLAQDLLQETFITIWKKIEQYHPERGRFYTWAYRIARNKVLNSKRTPQKLIQVDDFSVYDKEEEVIDMSSELFMLKGAIEQLSEHHKSALDLVYFKGLTHKEAHEEMGVPLGTFKSYVQQALRELRTKYKNSVLVIIILMLV